MSILHRTSEVYTKQIGQHTTVWQFAVILDGAVIGANCNINCHTFIEGNVTIGNSVTIKSGVYLWSGIEVENNVFIGPNATFTNDKYPRSKQYPNEYQKTIVKEGASIGANATILGGITIGCFAIIAAGTVVTKSVPDYALVVGNPGRVCGWVDKKGQKLTAVGEGQFKDDTEKLYIIQDGQLKEA